MENLDDNQLPTNDAINETNPSEDKCADTQILMREAIRPKPPVTRSFSRPRRSAWRFFAPIFIIAFVAAAFMPALDASYVDWDDTSLLRDNRDFCGLSGKHIGWMFTTPMSGHYQPLSWVSYAIDHVFWTQYGWRTFGFHFTNILLHALTAVAFYFVVRQLLAIGFKEKEAKCSDNFVLAATVGAFIFAVHPLRVESIAWLVERRDVLSGLFYVLCVACYLRYASGRAGLASVAQAPTSDEETQTALAPETSGSGGAGFYILAIAFCLLSLLSKASAITLFAVLLVLDFYPLRRLGGRTSNGGDSATKVLLEKLPFLGLGLIFGVVALWAQSRAGALNTLGEYGLLERFAQSCYGLMFYVWKTLWPANLGPMYEIPASQVLVGRLLWFSALPIIIVAFIVLQRRRSMPALAAALAAYVVILLPVLGFAQSGRQLVADRYSYLSCMGLAVLAALVLLQVIRGRWRVAQGRHQGPLATLLAAVVVALLAHRTISQTEYWQDPVQLWERGVEVSPQSSVAHVNYADALMGISSSAGTPDAAGLYRLQAIHHYKSGLDINPNDAIAWHHLADACRMGGDKPSATKAEIKAYLQVLKQDPNRRGAHLHLARLFIDIGQYGQAIVVLKDGADRTPDEWEMVRFLAELLATHPDDSIRDGREALMYAQHVARAAAGSDARVLLTLASAMAESGDCDGAIASAEKAVELAERVNNTLLATQAKQRLELFREGKPYHRDE